MSLVSMMDLSNYSLIVCPKCGRLSICISSESAVFYVHMLRVPEDEECVWEFEEYCTVGEDPEDEIDGEPKSEEEGPFTWRN